MQVTLHGVRNKKQKYHMRQTKRKTRSSIQGRQRNTKINVSCKAGLPAKSKVDSHMAVSDIGNTEEK